MRFSRRLILTLLFFATAAPMVALAAVPEAKLTPMTDDELDSYRGGYSPTPDLNFQFGAVMTTIEDGQLALQTTINLTPTSVSVLQTPGAGVTPGMTLNPIDLAGSTGGAFSTSGGTTFVQSITNGQLTNAILNTASNHTFIQTTDVTLTLPGFADVQTQMLRNLTGMRLSMDTSAATIRSLNH